MTKLKNSISLQVQPLFYTIFIMYYQFTKYLNYIEKICEYYNFRTEQILR